MNEKKYISDVTNFLKTYFKLVEDIKEKINYVEDISEKEKDYRIKNKQPLSIKKSFEVKNFQKVLLDTTQKINSLESNKNQIEEYLLDILPENILIEVKHNLNRITIKKVMNTKTKKWILDLKYLDNLCV
jgi:hypothetical protein